MKTSLIITTYNWKEALAAVFESVKRQTTLPDEIIIADDGSDADTKQLVDFLAQLSPVPLIHSRIENKGFRLSKSRNEAIAKAQGDYIIMIDGDMILSSTFIESHLSAAKKGWFVQGGRVLTDKDCSSKIMNSDLTPNIFSKGLRNRKNCINSKLLSTVFSYERNNAKATRGCNMAFWRNDAIVSNGFNEEFLGWGREDSEFTHRLLNLGLKRLYLKFSGIAYHLYHVENTRELLTDNQKILDDTINLKRTRCDVGVSQYLPKAQQLPQTSSIKTSLIITTYNWEKALSVVLDSVKKQVELPFEVIIADDGSTDETKLLIEKMSQNFPVPLFHCWQEDKDFRAAQIRNKAIAQAKGDYIVMIDGDMFLSPKFIKSHNRNAKPGWFVQGCRALLDQSLTDKIIKQPFTPSVFTRGVKNRKNCINSPTLSKLTSYKRNNVKSTRTCNFAVWRQDVIDINGFDNNFIGWGREDSEFVERLLNSGKNRLYLKFSGLAYHLYHHANNREQLPENDKRLKETITKKLRYCENGINHFIAK